MDGMHTDIFKGYDDSESRMDLVISSLNNNEYVSSYLKTRAKIEDEWGVNYFYNFTIGRSTLRTTISSEDIRQGFNRDRMFLNDERTDLALNRFGSELLNGQDDTFNHPSKKWNKFVYRGPDTSQRYVHMTNLENENVYLMDLNIIYGYPISSKGNISYERLFPDMFRKVDRFVPNYVFRYYKKDVRENRNITDNELVPWTLYNGAIEPFIISETYLTMEEGRSIVDRPYRSSLEKILVTR
jgi:hypothetical protein